MTARELVNMMRAVPFVPFEIHLSDSRSFVIEHPEFMAITSDYKTLLISMDPDETNNYQTVARIDLRHITGITENSSRRPRRRRKGA
jgi:hypothetical protein